MSETLQTKDQSNTPRCEATPRPWTTEETNDHGASVRIMDEQEVTIALCYQQPFDTWTAKANAAYIVKACNAFPELLSACKQAVDDCTVEGVPNFSRFQPTLSSMDALLSAIQKAEANG